MSELLRLHCQMRAELSGAKKLVGHAAVFRTMADLGTHYESLAPTAFADVMKDPQDDPRALFNHDVNMVLGRKRSGTLRYGVDSEGLPFEVDLPDTSYANDLRAVMERQDVDECSFAFFQGKSTWLRAPDGKPHERQDSIRRLLDLSVVTYPAYQGTSAMLRAMEFTDTPESLRSQLARARHRVLFGKANNS